jgi:hypothetical protein
MAFDNNVFINCPFDDDYQPILKSILFTIISCGYQPLLSENKDSSESRLHSIQNLIEASRYSIHDLSRMEASKKGQLARFNMPFELGMDFGCKRYKGGEQINKKCLILDKERYRYHKALSDLSGIDISGHSNSPETATRHVRNWLQKQQNENEPSLMTASDIWTWYNEFEGNFEAKTNQSDRDQMPLNEYFNFIKKFLFGKRTSA